MKNQSIINLSTGLIAQKMHNSFSDSFKNLRDPYYCVFGDTARSNNDFFEKFKYTDFNSDYGFLIGLKELNSDEWNYYEISRLNGDFDLIKIEPDLDHSDIKELNGKQTRFKTEEVTPEFLVNIFETYFS